ncbi:MAG: site-specific integrase [Pseudomonadota bacterium]
MAYDRGAEIIRTALKLMASPYPRPGELQLSYWSEFNLEKGIWTIPAERMKMRHPHRKPLVAPVVDLLRDLKEKTDGKTRVFPSLTGRDRPISENTMNQALRRMSFSRDEMTSHGFRASASSLIKESGHWNPDAIEAELAHIGGNQVRRAEYWDERVRMVEWRAGELELVELGA